MFYSCVFSKLAFHQNRPALFNELIFIIPYFGSTIDFQLSNICTFSRGKNYVCLWTGLRRTLIPRTTAISGPVRFFLLYNWVSKTCVSHYVAVSSAYFSAWNSRGSGIPWRRISKRVRPTTDPRGTLAFIRCFWQVSAAPTCARKVWFVMYEK